MSAPGIRQTICMTGLVEVAGKSCTNGVVVDRPVKNWVADSLEYIEFLYQLELKFDIEFNQKEQEAIIDMHATDLVCILIDKVAACSTM